MPYAELLAKDTTARGKIVLTFSAPGQRSFRLGSENWFHENFITQLVYLYIKHHNKYIVCCRNYKWNNSEGICKRSYILSPNVLAKFQLQSNCKVIWTCWTQFPATRLRQVWLWHTASPSEYCTYASCLETRSIRSQEPYHGPIIPSKDAIPWSTNWQPCACVYDNKCVHDEMWFTMDILPSVHKTLKVMFLEIRAMSILMEIYNLN